MQCSIVLDPLIGTPKEIRADNGAPSILYEHIKRAIPYDHQPDLYTMAFYNLGEIKGFSREEVALALWTKLTKGPLADALKNNDAIRRDKNGEPLFSTVQHLILPEVNKDYYLSGSKGLFAFIRGLEDKGLIQRVGDEYQLMDQNALPNDTRPGTEQSAIVISNMLSWLGISSDAAAFEERDGIATVRFREELFTVTDRIADYHEQVNVRFLVGYLADRFPQLKIRFVSAAEAEQALKDSKDLDFTKVNSFVQNGTVYLIEGRVNDTIAIEEVLHPFVHTLAKTDQALFDQLLKGAKQDFPKLQKEIDQLYTKNAGFTEEDRSLELVTQALSRVVAGMKSSKHQTSTSQNTTDAAPAARSGANTEQTSGRLKALMRDFFEWLLQKVQEIKNAFQFKQPKGTRTTKWFPSMQLADIGKALNTMGASFFIDPASMRASFSLSDEREAYKRRIIQKANPLQRKVINALFTPTDPVAFDAESKDYENANGVLYESLISAISGSVKEAEGKDGLRKIFGKNHNQIIQLLVRGEKFNDIADRVEGVYEGLASTAYRELQKYLKRYVMPDDVVLPNMVVADHVNEVAATLDLVIVQADGKIRVINFNIAADSIYDKTKYEQEKTKVGSKSRLTDLELSAKQRHGIKVGGYRRLLENNGYPVDQMISLYIHIPNRKEWQNKLGLGAPLPYQCKIEDTIQHPPGENRSFINKLLPLAPVSTENKIDRYQQELGQGNPLLDEDFLTDEEQMPEDPLQEDPEDHLTVKKATIPQSVKDIAARVDELVKSVRFNPKTAQVQQLSKLIKLVQHELTKGQAKIAFSRFLNESLKEVDAIVKYLADEENKKDPDYVKVAIDASVYLKTFEGIGNAFELGLEGAYHSAKLNTLQKLLVAAEHRIQLSLEEYVVRMTKSLSKREFTEKDWEDLVKEAIDISKADYYFGDIDTSTDTLIAIAAKTYKIARLSAMERIRQNEILLKAAGNKLAKVMGGKPDFRPILEEDEKGKLTGRIVLKIGPQYYEALEELEKVLQNNDGTIKQYREITSLADARPEDLAHNKELYKANKAIRDFKAPEIQTATGTEHGMYHKFVDEFIKEREKYEEYKTVVDDQGNFITGYWEQKEGVNDALYHKFRKKYYEQVVYDKAVFENNEFTGMHIKNGASAWFVKQEYVEIREVAGNGKSMVSKKWQALQNDQSAKGQALREFYDFYIQQMKETLDLLPPNVQRNMYGKIARVRANFIERARRSPNFFKAVVKSLADWFSMRTYAKAALHNEDGTLAGQIPIFLVGNLRDEQRIERLKAEISQLDNDYKSNRLSRDRYLQERSKKRDALRAAERALSADEINTDLVENLMEFRSMAENYAHMNHIEGAMLAVQRVLGKRKYKYLDAKGNIRKDPFTGEDHVLEAGKESWAYKRFSKWLEMVFYHKDDMDRGTFDTVTKKLMSASSLINVGFNGFGALHNYAMARINTIIESAGGLFYTREAAWRAIVEFEKKFLPGYFASINKTEGYYYKTKKSGSKYEAIAKHFNIYRQQQSGENRIDTYLAYGFLIMEAGEYTAQTKSGIAYLMSKEIVGPGNTTVSIYDAYDYDPETGHVTLKPGFDFPDPKRHETTNAIWEMNKQIHGNYAWEDRMVIQQETLGQVAAHYHKWVYPMKKARLRHRYFDENLGWLEGRFNSLYALFKYMYEEQGNILQKIKGGFQRLDPIQIKNMYKNAAELSFFMLSFAAYGVFRGMAEDTDDDNKIAKSWLNFLSWETDRVYKEILFWVPVAGYKEQMRLVKNPLPVAATVEKFVGIMSEGLNVVAPPYDDDIYYDKGPFRGELRFKKELFDVLPLMKDINKWQSFSQVVNFQVL